MKKYYFLICLTLLLTSCSDDKGELRELEYKQQIDSLKFKNEIDKQIKYSDSLLKELNKYKNDNLEQSKLIKNQKLANNKRLKDQLYSNIELKNEEVKELMYALDYLKCEKKEITSFKLFRVSSERVQQINDIDDKIYLAIEKLNNSKLEYEKLISEYETKYGEYDYPYDEGHYEPINCP